MKMNLDDPKLTAFALGELDEPERSTIARRIADSPDAQRFLDETRELANALKTEFAGDLEEKTTAPATLIDTRLAPGASPEYRPPDEAPLPAIRPATKVPCP